MSRLGDVNGDGFCDLAVTATPPAPLFPPGSQPAPRVTDVFSGANWSILYTLSGAVVAGAGGRCVSLGDLTGDGNPEFVIEHDVLTQGIEGRSVFSGVNGSILASLPHAGGDFGNHFQGAELTGGSPTEVLAGEPFHDQAGTDAGRLLVVSLVSLASASSIVLGGACGGAALPVMTTPPFVLGSLATVGLTGGTPNAIGNLAADIAPPVATPLPSGCVFHLNSAHIPTWILIPIATNGSGAASLQFAIPTIPQLAGTTVTMQMVLLGTSGPLGFDLTNGIAATLGY
jgi:hypothetical protein